MNCQMQEPVAPLDLSTAADSNLPMHFQIEHRFDPVGENSALQSTHSSAVAKNDFAPNAEFTDHTCNITVEKSMANCSDEWLVERFNECAREMEKISQIMCKRRKVIGP